MDIVKIVSAVRIRRHSLFLMRGPVKDFGVGVLVLPVGKNPVEDFTVAFSGSELLVMAREV